MAKTFYFKVRLPKWQDAQRNSVIFGVESGSEASARRTLASSFNQGRCPNGTDLICVTNKKGQPKKFMPWNS